MSARRTALAQARRGAAFLDGRFGRAWRRKIRRRDLDMAAVDYHGKGDCGCIVAQLYGDYSRGIDELGLTGHKEKWLGFETSGSVDYDDLTEAWREVLRETS